MTNYVKLLAGELTEWFIDAGFISIFVKIDEFGWRDL